MKILWITNILFPEATEKLLGKGELRGSGGWMLASAEMLTDQEGIELYVATISTLVHKLEIIKGDKITYYVIPHNRNKRKYEPYWKRIKEDIKPDVVHIHGTESTHGLAYINACGCEHVVVSIQGLKSRIAHFYNAGLTWKEIFSNLTYHDIIKGSIYKEQRDYYRSGKLEKEIIQKVKHIIGRTSWDKAQVWSINPTANYFICNETLRPEFYNNEKWCFEKCIPFSIFISQGNYPLKGLHQVLKAMPLILKHHPNAKIRIAGADITKKEGINGLLRYRGYGKIINNLIKKLKLKDKVTFLGPLNGEQMKTEYLSTNVFICPSSIENSPNSLGEAQILGTPCVASYVGGIPDFMRGFEDYMYRFEEIDMLANIICKIFSSKQMINLDNKQAIIRHNPQINMNNLMTIYKHL